MANDLETLAQRWLRENSFDEALTKAEREMLRAASEGEVPCPNCDSEKREIRGGLLRWLCTDEIASKKVDVRGIRVHAAKITGELDLSFANVPFPLGLFSCRLSGSTDFRYATIPELYLNGSSTGPLYLDGVTVKGNVYLQSEFSARGEVRLLGARIGGNLECRGAKLNSLDYALAAEGAEIKGFVYLNDGFSALGKVTMLGARIGGGVDCDSGTFTNPGGTALDLSGARIAGDVYLRNGFSAQGDVDLGNAQIDGALNCHKGAFTTLSMEQAIVKGIFFWYGVHGPQNTTLNLINASVGAVLDERKSWPAAGNLELDGFVYQRITAGPTDAETRLQWLSLQKEFTPQPYRQLAKVLREMGDDEGSKLVLFELESQARAKDRRRVVCAPLRWLQLTEDTLARETVGYGVYPGWATGYLFGLVVMGWILHRRAHLAGAMAPTDKDAYKEFHDHPGCTPPNYQPFTPVIYSLENCVPLVKLGQDDRWQPDPHPLPGIDSIALAKGWKAQIGQWIDLALIRLPSPSPALLRWCRWIMIGLGWLLATFFVAGITGIIKTG